MYKSWFICAKQVVLIILNINQGNLRLYNYFSG